MGQSPFVLLNIFCLISAPCFALAAEPPTTPSLQARAELSDIEGVRPATNGFYPIWENTGHVEKAGDITLATTGAQVGIAGIAHLGFNPVNFVYRVPNAYLKVALFENEHWTVAAQGGFYYLMEEASRASFSPMYSSRLDNPDFSVALVPVSLASTYQVGQWLQLHQTVTALPVLSSGPIKKEVFFGYSLVAEITAKLRHSILFHASEVGFWNHDFAMLGASYRFHNSWAEFRLGYFYRFRSVGSQNGPLIGLGFLL